MASIAPVPFSGGTANGKPIKVVATATAGTTIHATSATTGVQDEIYLYAENTDTVTRRLTIEFGGVTSPDNLIIQDIPPGLGSFLVIPGIRLGGLGVALTVGAFASAANVIVITGNVNRYTA